MLMIRICHLFCVLALACCAVAATAKSLTVPLRFYGTRPAVQVMVGGQGPFLFLVDTGAGGPPARADASLVKRLGLVRKGQTKASDGSGMAEVDIDEVTLPDVKLGSFAMPNVAALSRDYGSQSYLPKLDGILGPAFFQGHLLTIDYVNSRLKIEDGELPPADGRDVLSFELDDGIWIPINIGGQSMRAVLDTGDIRAVDMPAEALKPMRLASSPRLAGNSTSVSGTTAIREVTLSAPLRIGRHQFEKPAVTFSEDFHDVVIGSAQLQDFIITIDQTNRRVRFVRSAH
jgi:hypothetical protein